MKDGLNELKYSWNEFAKKDAMGAVLTGKEWNEESFYQSGREEVDSLMEEVLEIYPGLNRARSLDFGCGLGRLTFALSKHFRHVTGIDISKKMIERATANRRNSDGVEFVLNESRRLTAIPSDSVDFLLSLIVLQHIPKKCIKGYISEFLRVTKPGGLFVFQIPTRRVRDEKKERYWEGRPLNWDSPSLGKLCYRATVRFIRWIPRKVRELALKDDRLHRFLFFCKLWGEEPVMRMNTMKKSALERFLKKEGGVVLKCRQDSAAGDALESFTFFVLKESGTGQDRADFH